MIEWFTTVQLVVAVAAGLLAVMRCGMASAAAIVTTLAPVTHAGLVTGIIPALLTGGTLWQVPMFGADALLAGWPRVQLPDDEAGRFLTGLRRRVSLADAAAVRVYGPDDAFLGSAHIAGGELIADRLLSPAEVAGLHS